MGEPPYRGADGKTKEREGMKKRSILTRIAVISVLMAIAAMLLGGVIFFALFRQRAVKNMEERLQSTINICCFQIYDYKTYMWLLDYWKEHGDEMEVLPYGGRQIRTAVPARVQNCVSF